MAELAYATPEDLQEYTGKPPPADAVRQLQRASEDIDSRLITAVYPVDANGMPTDPKHIEALKLATCSVVEWWDPETGTGDELGVQGAWTSVSAGSVSLSRGGGGSSDGGSTNIRPGWLPPRTIGYLQRAGLIPGTVYTR